MERMNGLPPPNWCDRWAHSTWTPAAQHLTIEDDGLATEWPAGARIWCNPPYGAQCSAWLRKMARHGNGIALTFARTETKMFFQDVWNKADAVLFISGRLRFYHVTGKVCESNAGAPSVLIAYGRENSEILKVIPNLGKYICLK